MNSLIKLYRFPDAPAGAAVAEPPAAAVAPASVTAPASAGTTVNINDAAKPAAGTPPAFALPDVWKDKPYLKGVDSMEKVFTMLDGAQNLIGKNRVALPGENATQAELDAFYESVGRPKTSGEYTFKTNDATDKNFIPKVQAAMHKYGLSAKQAAGVWDDVNVALMDYAKEKGIVQKQMDVDFTKLATDSFGAERDAVLSRGKELIKELASPTMKQYVENLPNEALVVMADILRNADKKYIRPDGPGAPPTIGTGTPDQLRVKAKEMMEQQRGLDPMSTQFQNLQTEINKIYDTIRKSMK